MGRAGAHFPALELNGTRFDWSRAYIVGVLNVTPDSFSDGGRFVALEDALRHGDALAVAGADIIDIGGESTRPNAAEVGASEEIDRVCPVIEGLRQRTQAPISVDTTKASVARAAVGAGADLVNDVSGGLFDSTMVTTVDALGVPYVCSHLRGNCIAQVHAQESTPPTFDEVVSELVQRITSLPKALRRRTIADPGLGFGKPAALNVELLRRVDELIAMVGCPVMVGPSRKRFLGALTAQPADGRDAATIGAALAAVAGGAHLLRVHSVQVLKSALLAFEAIRIGVRE